MAGHVETGWGEVFCTKEEFSACAVERTGREVSERTISCWEKGRLPGPDDIIREDS